MSLTSLGFILIIAGIALLIMVPIIITTSSFMQGHYNITGVGGAACIIIFFIPICFSTGIPPIFTIALAVIMVIIIAIFMYIAIRIARTSRTLMGQ